MKEKPEEITKRVLEGQKNYDANIDSIENILMNERGYVFDIPYKEDVVVLCSGGPDSIVMIDMLIKEWNVKAHLLFFKRGARAEKHEEDSFDYFVDFYRKKYPDNIGEIAKLDYSIPPKEFKKDFPVERALSVGHPLRNSTMENLAVMYAVALNKKLDVSIRTVFTGSIGDDTTSPESGLLSLRSQTLNTCINFGEWQWQITSSLIESTLEDRPLYKTDLIKYAGENNIPLEKTRSCFSEEKIACGTCAACQRRLKAFEYVGLKDPLPYKMSGGDEKKSKENN